MASSMPCAGPSAWRENTAAAARLDLFTLRGVARDGAILSELKTTHQHLVAFYAAFALLPLESR
jgi:hypothetical protein